MGWELKRRAAQPVPQLFIGVLHRCGRDLWLCRSQSDCCWLCGAECAAGCAGFAGRVWLAGDGSNAIKIFGQPDRLELAAAAAAASPSGPAGGQEQAANDSSTEAEGLASPSHQQHQQQQVEPLPEVPGAPWELLCSVAAAHSADVNCVRWHPTDPTLLASASDDGLIKLWRLHRPGAAAAAAAQ